MPEEATRGPATLIRSARERAGMTQAALADRAGTSAPTISAYEHGTRHPRADVLLRLLAAAGLEPVLVASTRATPATSTCTATRSPTSSGLTRPCSTGPHQLDRMDVNDNVAVWRTVLDAGPAAVVAVLTSRDPDVRGLKADNPFARLELIDESARLALLDRARGR